MTMWREGDVEDHGNAEGSWINDAQLEAILKDLQAKAALLKKMGIGETPVHNNTQLLVGLIQVAGLPTL